MANEGVDIMSRNPIIDQAEAHLYNDAQPATDYTEQPTINPQPMQPDTLKPHLKWHGARLSFLALFLIALFRVKTVNLAELSTGFVGKAKTESNYKRLQRFLREFDLDYYALSKSG